MDTRIVRWETEIINLKGYSLIVNISLRVCPNIIPIVDVELDSLGGVGSKLLCGCGGEQVEETFKPRLRAFKVIGIILAWPPREWKQKGQMTGFAFRSILIWTSPRFRLNGK